jgi:hypothetical protein
VAKEARERFSSSVHRGGACVRHRLVVGSLSWEPLGERRR